MKTFYNCHVHVFTAEAAPPRFLPFRLLPIARNRVTGPLLGWLLRNLQPFSKSDPLERLAAFATIGRLPSQAAVLDEIHGYYSTEFRFVVLTLDMDYMGAGCPDQSYEEQLGEAVALRQRPDVGSAVLPFVCADPRRPDVGRFVQDWVDKEDKCVGIKLYPPLGFWPNDPRLRDVYAFAEEAEVPVLAHCSRGGVRYMGPITEAMRVNPMTNQRIGGGRRKVFGAYADPDGWRKVLEEFPRLRLCLAHYGGGDEWNRYLRNAQPVRSRDAWIRKISDLIEDNRYPHVFADISTTAAESERLPLISVLANRPETRDFLLFGSDFFMIQQSTTERQFGLGVRAAVGEPAWERVASTNACRWLGSWA